MKSHVGVGEESARQLPNSLCISDHMREATHRAETPWVSVLWSRLHNCGRKEKWKTSHCGHNPEAEVSAVAPSRAIRFPLQRKAFKKPLYNLPVRSDVQWSGIQHSTRPRNIKTAERRQEQERREFWGVPVWSVEAEGLTTRSTLWEKRLTVAGPILHGAACS